MATWIALGDRPLGTFEAVERDDAISRSRDLFGWSVWAVEYLQGRQWMALRREPIGEVEAPAKDGAERRARAKFGAEVVAVQSKASWQISQDDHAALRHRVAVRNG